jgi:hypothetical protein
MARCFPLDHFYIFAECILNVFFLLLMNMKKQYKISIFKLKKNSLHVFSQSREYRDANSREV